MRIAHGDHQRVVLEADRHDAIQLGHRLGDVAQHLGRDDRLAEADDLHAHLLGQGLGQLVVGDQAHALGDLAQQFVGALLLLFEQHFELVVVDEAKIDEDLADTPHCHRVTAL